MNEYKIIELSNGIEYVLIDILDYNNKKYFLSTKVNENNINDIFEVLLYDEKNNSLLNLENKEEYDYLYSIFEERLNNKKIELDIISNIDYNKLIKFKVTDIEGYIYKLNYNNKFFIKNIEFYSKSKPTKNDYIYLSEKNIKEDILQFGHIIDLNNIKDDEILIIESENKKIYLQKYYG